MPILTRLNILIVLLEHIDLEWQHETNSWEGLPCPLPFYSAVLHFKHIPIVTIIKHILLKFATINHASILLFAFVFGPIIPTVLPAKSTHP